MATAEMSPTSLIARSLDQARDHNLAAGDVYDAALANLADFHQQVQLWGEEEHRYGAELERRLDTAHKARCRAHERLAYVFAEYVRAIHKPSPDHES